MLFFISELLFSFRLFHSLPSLSLREIRQVRTDAHEWTVVSQAEIIGDERQEIYGFYK